MKLDTSVEEAIVAVVEGLNYDLYNVKYFTAGGKTTLRIFADTDEGISMDECAKISHAVSEVLDEKEFGNKEYTLEVSSPGLDRPLENQRDYRRFVGKEVQVRFENDKGKAKKFSGTVLDAGEESVLLKDGDTQESFKYDELLSGKVII